MRTNKLYKFSVGTLKKVQDELHHRILDFHLGYNDEMSRRMWTAIDKKRSELMVELIDKQMRERRIIRNLERLVGARNDALRKKPSTHNLGKTRGHYIAVRIHNVDWTLKRTSWTHSQAVNKSPTHYPCDSARTFRVILFSIHNDEWKSFQCHHQTALRRPYALSWKPCQGDSLNLPDHRIHKDGDGDASFQLKSDSLPHAHAQTTKTFYKHQDSRIMKAQELKTKTSAQTLIYKIFLQRYQVYQGRLLAIFQDDAKYEHVGQDTRSQGGKDDQDGRIKI
ncbi:hypothetical protein Tco_1420839 [Tanacetum coccineum]